ncbi:MAG: hypothetical protein A3H42_06310 [Deltaproteobacteria bacterium RIFCSPLOWO2_02_FULL_46_8]|nr:MAG: hypothetical protein A3H42_06310 [Deltaproteobacteria bacterium RIFCSPLOWO2_02_FULL_46_8]
MIISGVFTAVVTILLWILSQILVLGFCPRHSHFKVGLFLYGLSFVGFLVWEWPTSWLNLLNGGLLHILFYCTFMEFYYYIDRPITLRILVEARKNLNRVLDINKLHQTYDLKYMIQRRLKSLVASGYIAEKNANFYLTTKGKIFAKIFEKGSKIFGVIR